MTEYRHIHLSSVLDDAIFVDLYSIYNENKDNFQKFIESQTNEYLKIIIQQFGLELSFGNDAFTTLSSRLLAGISALEAKACH